MALTKPSTTSWSTPASSLEQVCSPVAGCIDFSVASHAAEVKVNCSWSPLFAGLVYSFWGMTANTYCQTVLMNTGKGSLAA